MPAKTSRPPHGRPETNPLKAPAAYRTVQSLEALEKACSAPVVVECMMGRERIRFEGRRLKPCEERRIKELMESAFPPELPPDQPGDEPRYDFRNPDYLATKETARRKARAMVLYLAYPLFGDPLREQFKDGKPPTEDQVLEFIESRAIDVSVLDLAHEMVMREIVMVDARHVGFTSGGNSPAS